MQDPLLDGDELLAPAQPAESDSIPRCFRQLALWWALSLGLGICAFAIMQPRQCSDDTVCSKLDGSLDWPLELNRMACAGLVTLFVHESMNLLINWRNARMIVKSLSGIRSSFLPDMLVVITFGVLLLHNAVFAFSSEPWYAHASAPGVRSLDSAPVYTNVYVEWLINVPILLVIAGKCALQRPLHELNRPVLITNFYIITAWVSNFISETQTRWGMIAFTFGLYAWATWDMAEWVTAYIKDAPDQLSSRFFRPFLTLGLVVVFGVYGVIYLMVFFWQIELSQERNYFLFCDVGSKIVMSLAFGGIRGSEYHSRLVKLLKQSNLLSIYKVRSPSA
eukprot:TRINITY_DN7707_c0_g1_i1.p1 TRINITY_DN7707_c0_g1~~TRINITY_DN7707_c0_g1_i1.p1  ORF type:complete len:335 (-),score=65.30 TRINITY_DN7707_c0_g1_i1:268-1272(-)